MSNTESTTLNGRNYYRADAAKCFLSASVLQDYSSTDTYYNLILKALINLGSLPTTMISAFFFTVFTFIFIFIYKKASLRNKVTYNPNPEKVFSIKKGYTKIEFHKDPLILESGAEGQGENPPVNESDSEETSSGETESIDSINSNPFHREYQARIASSTFAHGSGGDDSNRPNPTRYHPKPAVFAIEGMVLKKKKLQELKNLAEAEGNIINASSFGNQVANLRDKISAAKDLETKISRATNHIERRDLQIAFSKLCDRPMMQEILLDLTGREVDPIWRRSLAKKAHDLTSHIDDYNRVISQMWRINQNPALGSFQSQLEILKMKDRWYRMWLFKGG